MFCLLQTFFHKLLRCSSKIKLKYACLAFGAIAVLDYFGAFTHMFEVSYDDNFIYPYDGDVQPFVDALRNNKKPDVPPINDYAYKFVRDVGDKCAHPDYATLRLVFLVKSSAENFERRVGIRQSWGFGQRFFYVPTVTVFLLGVRPNDVELQARINAESNEYNDILQADFVDAYYNNTIKTMMGFKWAVERCGHSKFYMFVDDDMYVSVKNVLRFIRNPAYYPDYFKEPGRMAARKREIKDSDLTDITDDESPVLPRRSHENPENQTFPIAKFTKRATAKEKIMMRRRPGWTSHNKTKMPVSQRPKKIPKTTERNLRNNENEISFSTTVGAKKMRSRRPKFISRDEKKSSVSRMSEKIRKTNETNFSENEISSRVSKLSVDRDGSSGNREKRQIFDLELPDDVRLFAGYVIVSSPHRHRTSKWYVSLKEYPYHLWPPYVTAGAYILSREALLDMYYTSLYTQHFRFDDIFLGIVAKKADIEPFHCDEFHFYKKDYTMYNYKYVITSHGYDDPEILQRVWQEQKSLGNA